MSILSDYFDKVYCINLDRRPDRWEKVLKTFTKLGFDEVERYSAVDGNELDLSKITYNPSLLKGELGILETHLKIIKEAKEKGYKQILVMEDDVVFTDEIVNLKEYMDEVPNKWDMLFFGGNHKYGKQPIGISPKIIKLNFTVAIHCVAIKDTMYDSIIELAENRQKQIDGYYGDLQKTFNVYSFTPNMALQYEDFSDIQNRVVNYDGFLKD